MADLNSLSSPSVKEARAKYNNDRFFQLNSLMASATTSTWSYLLAVNGGGAAGMLAFIGAVKELAAMSWPYVVLWMFVAGLISVGMAHAFVVHRLEGLISNWIDNTSKYWQDQITWAEVIRRDDIQVKRLAWMPWLLGWIALLLFLAGVATAAINFSSLATLQA